MDHKISKDMISSGMIPSGEKTQADLGRTQYGSAPSPSSLADAYKSIYEHHQKDKDGNTIPHEGEELNEVAPLLAAPLIAKGLMAAKTAAAVAAKSKMGAAALKGAAAFKKGLTTAKAVGAAGKITTSGGKLAAGAKKVGMAQKAGQYTRSGLAAMKNNPLMTTVAGTQAYQATPFGAPKMPKAPRDPRAKMTGARTAGVYASADLFDIVKGQLLDEGIDEKDALKIMVELSQQDLNDIVNEKFDINKVRILPAAAKLGAAALVTQQIASRMGKKSGEESIKPKKKNFLDTLRQNKERTETDVKNLNTGNY